jgi:protein-tyrosine-phosphatase
MSGVLFICTGNMCRSPLAEAKFKAIMHEYGLSGWKVASAGTWVPNHLKADERIIRWALDEHLDLRDHNTQRVTGKLLSEYNLIVVMTNGHKEAILANYPGFDGNVMGLSQLTGPFYDIPDPVTLPDDEFKEIAKEIVDLVEKGFNEIIKKLMVNLVFSDR